MCHSIAEIIGIVNINVSIIDNVSIKVCTSHLVLTENVVILNKNY